MMNTTTSESIFHGNRPPVEVNAVTGEFADIKSEKFYCIKNYNSMAPFFMTIVSDSDHWLFVSSNGSLTAGRKHSGLSLFPYYTEDKIHDMAEVTGPKTICRIESDGRMILWEPFSDRYMGIHRIQRNLYKSEFGNKVLFEEINLDLELSFKYMWKFSDEFGIIKESQIENNSKQTVNVDLVDGIQNILPWGVNTDFQLYFSNLGDAYKKNELEIGARLGIYSYSSIPGDKAEPMESLKANTCFSVGFNDPLILVSSKQLNAFRNGLGLETENETRGARGAYFLNVPLTLAGESSRTWSLVADVNMGPSDVGNLIHRIGHGNLQYQLDKDVLKGTARLKMIVGSADGIQKTNDNIGSIHHFANCLFNVMRGGVFAGGYSIQKQDLLKTIQAFNRAVFEKNEILLETLPKKFTLEDLNASISMAQDSHLERIAKEYLPLFFSRRHGDPSRPWNIFSIDLKDEKGTSIFSYQGNWRDIFQNWEALSLSYPDYAEGFICKFLNSSTADGYNPYRIGKLGFDWEKPHPNEPWSNIGYWGDHQLIYLVRLLEWSRNLNPGRLDSFLRKEFFVYADVPYEIKPYEDLVKNPKNTINYSPEREAKVKERVSRLGLDGQYVQNFENNIHTVNLVEKLLVPLLAKISNFVPGSGIWLNTQRPEWNDANNALAGFGLSMVTLYYARRYTSFVKTLIESSATKEIILSIEVHEWLAQSHQVLVAGMEQYLVNLNPASPKALVDSLGKIAAKYRKGLYEKSFSGKKIELDKTSLVAFLNTVLEYMDQAIQVNRRKDGLYHSYNVFNPVAMKVGSLYEMLEGQVAVLSSGALSARESITVLKALRTSKMYRADQHSYLLYPDKELPRFIKKNIIPEKLFLKMGLLQKLVADQEQSVIERDIQGQLYFSGNFKNASDLTSALENLKLRGYAELVAAEQTEILNLFESVFDHESFTGRSGTFFGYEGLGSIYWHMVSKLLLAIQENLFSAMDKGQKQELEELQELYFDIRSGISFNKSPAIYGAFPSDPYSHTPENAGAKQPGMTGQVKEEIITRMGELGLRMGAGTIQFQPILLKPTEFLEAPSNFEFFNVDGNTEKIPLEKGSLGFTLCQVPIVYHLANHQKLEIHYRNGTVSTLENPILDPTICRQIYSRSGLIRKIDLFLNLNNKVNTLRSPNFEN